MYLSQYLNIESEQEVSQDSQSDSELHSVSRKTKPHVEECLNEIDIDEHVREDKLEASVRKESSEDDEPPEHFSLMDAKKQLLGEEEQKRQYLARYIIHVYDRLCYTYVAVLEIYCISQKLAGCTRNLLGIF